MRSPQFLTFQFFLGRLDSTLLQMVVSLQQKSLPHTLTYCHLRKLWYVDHSLPKTKDMLIMINGLSFLERHAPYVFVVLEVGWVLFQMSKQWVIFCAQNLCFSALQMSQHTLGITLNLVMVVGNMVFIYLGFSD